MVKVISSEIGMGFVVVLGLLLVIYGVMKGVMMLIEGLNIVYDEEEIWGYLWFYLIGFVIMLVLVVGFIFVIGLIVVLFVLVELLYLGLCFVVMVCWINWLIFVVFMMMGLVMLYCFGLVWLVVCWCWFSFGVVLVMVLWIVVLLGFLVYVSNFGSYMEIYGMLVGVILLLIWLWLLVYVIFVGVELNVEIEQQILCDIIIGVFELMGQCGVVKVDMLLLDLFDVVLEVLGLYVLDMVVLGLYVFGLKVLVLLCQCDDIMFVIEFGFVVVLVGCVVWWMFRVLRC